MTILCPACGLDFDDSRPVPCRSCPMKTNCAFVCCPRCGYRTIVSSPTTDRITRILKNWFGGERGRT